MNGNAAFILASGEGGGGGTSDYSKLSNKPKINDVVLNGELSLEDLGIPGEIENFEYENEADPNVTNAKEALDSLFGTVFYVKPSITSFTTNPSTLQYEIGNAVESVEFAWAVNKTITSQSLTGCEVALTDRSATYSTPFSTNKNFTLTVGDGKNTATSTKSFTFLPKVYCGAVADPGSYDSAFVVGLGGSLKSSKAGTYTLNIGANQYGFISVPTSYGQIASVKIGGFDTELVSCGTISVTNQSGYTQNYYLYKTPNPNLGNISMVVS